MVLFCVVLTSAAAAVDSSPPLRRFDPDLPDEASIRLMPRQIGEKKPGPASDPLRYVSDLMGRIVVDLNEDRTGTAVQARQQSVAEQLDVLIGKLEQACSACSACVGGRGSANPSKPLADSKITGGAGGVGAFIDPQAGKHKMASLDPKQREKILQSMSEGFPSAYEGLLRDYYRRLAQQRLPLGDQGAVDDPSQ